MKVVDVQTLKDCKESFISCFKGKSISGMTFLQHTRISFGDTISSHAKDPKSYRPALNLYFEILCCRIPESSLFHSQL